jgi:hypothetical protein
MDLLHGNPASLHIAMPALDGAFDTALAAVMDAFTGNELARRQGLWSLPFDLRARVPRLRDVAGRGTMHA